MTSNEMDTRLYMRVFSSLRSVVGIRKNQKSVRVNQPKGIFQESLATFAAGGTSLLCSFGFTLITVRMMPANDRGIFISVYSAAAIVSVISSLGIGTSARRQLVSMNARSFDLYNYLSTALVLSLAGAFGTVSYAILLFYKNDVESIVELSIIAFVFGYLVSINYLLSDALNALGLSAFSTLYTALSSLISLVVIGASFGLNASVSLHTVLIAVMCGSLLQTILLLAHLAPKISSGSGSRRRTVLRSGLRVFPFLLSQALAIRIDAAIFPLISSTRGASQYGLVVSITEALRVVSTAVGHRIVYRAATQDLKSDALEKALKAVILVQGGLAMLAIASYMVLGKKVFGDEYANLLLPLAVLLVAEFFMSVYVVRSRVWVGDGETRLLTAVGFAVLLVVLCTDLTLIPIFGVTGACVANLISNAVAALLSGRGRQRRKRDASLN